MLTSGTTGPPHRVDLTYETLERVMEGAKHYESNARAELRLRDRGGRGELADGAPRRAVPRPPSGDGRPQVRVCSNASKSSRGSTASAGTSRARSAWFPPRFAWSTTPTSTPPTSPACDPRCRVPHRSIPISPRPSPRGTGCPCSRRTRPPSSVVAWPAGTSVTTSSSRTRSAAASDGPTPGASFGWSTPTTVTPSQTAKSDCSRCKAEQIDPDQWIRTTDLVAPRRRRLPLDRRSLRPDDHARRVQSPARSCPGGARAAPRGQRRGGLRHRRRPAGPGSGGGRGAGHRRGGHRRRRSSSYARADWRAYEIPVTIASSTR